MGNGDWLPVLEDRLLGLRRALRAGSKIAAADVGVSEAPAPQVMPRDEFPPAEARSRAGHRIHAPLRRGNPRHGSGGIRVRRSRWIFLTRSRVGWCGRWKSSRSFPEYQVILQAISKTQLTARTPGTPRRGNSSATALPSGNVPTPREVGVRSGQGALPPASMQSRELLFLATLGVLAVNIIVLEFLCDFRWLFSVSLNHAGASRQSPRFLRRR